MPMPVEYKEIEITKVKVVENIRTNMSDIAELKVKGVVPDNYVGIQDAIALLEKMI